MIQFRREDNMAVCLLFDRAGLTELTDALKRSGGNVTTSSVNVTFDKSVLTLKRKSPNVPTSLIIAPGDITRISQVGEDIVWAITDEDRECLVGRFEQCESDGACIPAELIRVQIPKNKRLDYLCGELIQDRIG